ncbi:MAG: PD-(D/E)XK nuclease family protein [Candidatus Aenigmarchaeota archaeon]|nr:PD-(D/E)XK nuclease family protein [Candidatus Aenigmarchaeota archaeon]
MKILNKSQVNCFRDCPYKWHKIYKEGIRSKPSPAQQRGIRIHKKIERFYKNMQPDIELKNFIKFELQRAKDMVKEGTFDKKYFFPLFQELKLFNEKIGLKGTMDAVYINPEDDGLIVIDYKSGKYYSDQFDSYRFELAIYSELLKHSKHVDEAPKYWGILFVDQNKLFFEKINKKYVDKMYKIVEEARIGMDNGDCEPKKNTWCFNCQFRKSCGVFRK